MDDLSHTEILIKPSHPPPATHNLHNFRPAYTRNETSTDREVKQKSDEWDGETQRERAAANAVDLHSGSIQDSDRENSSSVGTSMRQEEPSLPQSTVGKINGNK